MYARPLSLSVLDNKSALSANDRDLLTCGLLVNACLVQTSLTTQTVPPHPLPIQAIVHVYLRYHKGPDAPFAPHRRPFFRLQATCLCIGMREGARAGTGVTTGVTTSSDGRKIKG